MKRSLNLAAAAYGLGSTALADAALVLSRRYPKSPWDRKARMLAALSKGGGAPWRAFGGVAFRIGGQTLRINSKPIVVEPAQ